MQSAVNSAGFINSIVVFGPRIIVTRGQFFHRDLIGRVAVNLVCAQENENGFRTMLASSFQQIKRAEGIDLEVQQRNVTGLVVGRLGRAMNDQIERVGLEQLLD